MIYLFVGHTLLLLWIVFEIWRAPEIDDNGKVTKPEKKLKDLFK